MWILACSGPNAPATIGRNIAYSQAQAVAVGVLTLISIAIWIRSHRRIRYTASCLLILSFHPAWTMSAIHGDCGHGMVAASVWASILGLAAIILQARYARRVRRARRGPIR
ncbi:hypothetical protein TA3x_001852 [Tundrisphaera sp. TA3]|uniref:hypothetical protein n=1 Tax=Tundrisphaera sp. TA3 TaxID=3435775 RepID=UPI003EC14794